MPKGVYKRTKNHRKVHKEGCNTPEAKANYATAAKKRYKDPEERKKQSVRMEIVGAMPKVQESKRVAALKRWANPEYRAKQCATQKIVQNRPEVNAKRIKNWFSVDGELKSQKEAYKELFEKQNGVCAVCGNSETKKVSKSDGKKIQSLAIDHDHKTGKVRGLLCHKCNVGLGHFMENVELLLKAIKYLKRE